MAFIESFLGYAGYFIFLVIMAACGFFAGKTLRKRKDAKTALENSDAGIKE